MFITLSTLLMWRLDLKNKEIEHDISRALSVQVALPLAVGPAARAAPVVKVNSVLTAPPTLAPSAPVSRPEAHYPEILPDNLVSFTLIDGFAVAYGDVLLGKPTGDTAGDLPHRHHLSDAPHARLWQRPEIGYSISPELPNPKRVEAAIRFFNERTPIKFVPYQGQRDGIVFVVGSQDCLSYLGSIGGLQPIRLSMGCGPTEIMHEIMHALGFIHEHSRTDRAQYVEVEWSNIDAKFQPQFAMAPDSLMDNLKGAPFDYHSIMLYRPRAFALNPNRDVLKSTQGESINPSSDGLSAGDIERIKRLYSR